MIRDATDADAEPLARLHAESLPSSLLTALGRAGLVRYYRFAISSPDEHVWVVDSEGVVGGCVLSDAPETVMNRFVRYAPLLFARDMGAAVAKSSRLRWRIVGEAPGLRALASTPSTSAGASDEVHKPEVTQIFTDAKRRGEGLGAQLLRTCEGVLRMRGVRGYFVHTHRDDNEAGIRFYRREGFEVIGESRSFGEAFLVMQKELD